MQDAMFQCKGTEQTLDAVKSKVGELMRLVQEHVGVDGAAKQQHATAHITDAIAQLSMTSAQSLEAIKELQASTAALQDAAKVAEQERKGLAQTDSTRQATVDVRPSLN
jgi:hypothetical protein